jgi:hypothetical protein
MTGSARSSGDDTDLGFSFTERRSGEIAIARHGRRVTVFGNPSPSRIVRGAPA